MSHNIDGNKFKLFKDAKIPVIRIKANKKWGRKKDYEMSKEDQEYLKNWIKNSFKKGFSADVLLHPKSKTFLENKVIRDLEIENKRLNTVVSEKEFEFDELDQNFKELEVSNKEIDRSNSFKERKIRNYEEEIKKLKVSNQKLIQEGQILKTKLNKWQLASISIILVLITVLFIFIYNL